MIFFVMWSAHCCLHNVCFNRYETCHPVSMPERLLQPGEYDPKPGQLSALPTRLLL